MDRRRFRAEVRQAVAEARDRRLRDVTQKHAAPAIPSAHSGGKARGAEAAQKVSGVSGSAADGGERDLDAARVSAGQRRFQKHPLRPAGGAAEHDKAGTRHPCGVVAVRSQVGARDTVPAIHANRGPARFEDHAQGDHRAVVAEEPSPGTDVARVQQQAVDRIAKVGGHAGTLRVNAHSGSRAWVETRSLGFTADA